SNNHPATLHELLPAKKRLRSYAIKVVKKDVTDLSDLYEKDPALRFQIATLLYIAGSQRNDSADAFKPIIPKLIAHLLDPDTKTREGAIRAIARLRPRAPLEALEPLISLSRTETEHEDVDAAIQAFATFCRYS